MNENDEMVWNGSVGMVMDKSVIEVIERKNGMGMDGIEWIENMDANGNEKQRCVVMRVIEVKQDGKGGWNNEQESMINEMSENEF